MLSRLLLLFLAVLWTESEAVNYRWTASIERSTGIATSREVSKAPHPLTQVQKTFASYPEWIAKPRVTFGILTAKQKGDGSTAMQVRLCRLEVLIFGKHTCKGKNTIILPITGGLLARPNECKEYGSLVFSLRDEHIVETGIDHGYRPSIAGRPPVSNLRAWTYRSTQSLMHAYVMWRFHNYCYTAATQE